MARWSCYHRAWSLAGMSVPPVVPTATQRLAMRERPSTPIVGQQRWSDLLFLHWKVAADAVQATLPPGSLEFFLVERYALFSTDRSGALHCGRVHHQPYRISHAVVPELSVEPARQAGFELASPPISTLCASAVDVSIFGLARLCAAPVRECDSDARGNVNFENIPRPPSDL